MVRKVEVEQLWHRALGWIQAVRFLPGAQRNPIHVEFCALPLLRVQLLDRSGATIGAFFADRLIFDGSRLNFFRGLLAVAAITSSGIWVGSRVIGLSELNLDSPIEIRMAGSQENSVDSLVC